MSKKRTTIYIEENKAKELKKKAIDANMSFSDYLATAGTITPNQEIKKSYQNSGGVPPQG